MDFGTAMQEARAGKKVRRTGWHNFHNVVIWVPPSTVKLLAGTPYAKHAGDGAEFGIAGHFDMLMAARDGAPDDPKSRIVYHAAQPGWLASQADIAADDWVVVLSAEPAQTLTVVGGTTYLIGEIYTHGDPNVA